MDANVDGRRRFVDCVVDSMRHLVDGVDSLFGRFRRLLPQSQAHRILCFMARNLDRGSPLLDAFSRALWVLSHGYKLSECDRSSVDPDQNSVGRDIYRYDVGAPLEVDMLGIYQWCVVRVVNYET